MRNNATFLALTQLSVTSFATHKKIGTFCCWFPGGWVCVCSKALWVSPMNSLVRLGVSPALQASQGFIARGFEALISLTGTLGCVVCLASHLFLLSYPHVNVGPPTPPAAILLARSVASPPQLPISAPPTSLVFFNSLVVRLPHSSIFWQFWMFLFLNLLLAFFWLWEEAKHIYLCLHLGWSSKTQDILEQLCSSSGKPRAF